MLKVNRINPRRQVPCCHCRVSELIVSYVKGVPKNNLFTIKFQRNLHSSGVLKLRYKLYHKFLVFRIFMINRKTDCKLLLLPFTVISDVTRLTQSRLLYLGDLPWRINAMVRTLFVVHCDTVSEEQIYALFIKVSIMNLITKNTLSKIWSLSKHLLL